MSRSSARNRTAAVTFRSHSACSLELAAERDLDSIAFPAISTGICGYPIEPAAKIAIATAKVFTQVPSSLREIIFCCYSAHDYELYDKLLSNT